MPARRARLLCLQTWHSTREASIVHFSAAGHQHLEFSSTSLEQKKLMFNWIVVRFQSPRITNKLKLSLRMRRKSRVQNEPQVGGWSNANKSTASTLLTCSSSPNTWILFPNLLRFPGYVIKRQLFLGNKFKNEIHSRRAASRSPTQALPVYQQSTSEGSAAQPLPVD